MCHILIIYIYYIFGIISKRLLGFIDVHSLSMNTNIPIRQLGENLSGHLNLPSPDFGPKSRFSLPLSLRWNITSFERKNIWEGSFPYLVDPYIPPSKIDPKGLVYWFYVSLWIVSYLCMFVCCSSQLTKPYRLHCQWFPMCSKKQPLRPSGRAGDSSNTRVPVALPIPSIFGGFGGEQNPGCSKPYAWISYGLDGFLLVLLD